MANVPDFLNLLCLDPKHSQSPFGGRNRTILIAKDFNNSADFAFNSLLQHFGRKEPNTRILLVTLSHDWSNYSASSAKCGFNLRKIQNMGNIQVLNVMDKFLENITSGGQDDDGQKLFNYCQFIKESVIDFIDRNNNDQTKDNRYDSSTGENNEKTDTPKKVMRPTIVMIDDLSILLTIGSSVNEVFQLVLSLNTLLRTGSECLPADRVNHFIIQTMFTNINTKQHKQPRQISDKNLNYLISNIENICDVCITLKPLDTGHSNRVDGTIKILDNRLKVSQNHPDKTAAASSLPPKPLPLQQLSMGMFPDTSSDIGSTRAYFYKLGDRRARLTSSALIF